MTFPKSALLGLLAVGLVLPVAAADRTDRIAELEKQVAALQQQIAAQQAAMEKLLGEQFKALNQRLDAKFSALEKKIASSGPPGAEQERAAAQALAEVNKLIRDAKYEDAKKKMAELQKQYGRTQTAGRARRLQQELAVFGKAGPKNLGIEKWYQGDIDLENGATTLYVFWELWCPHCKREVPKVEQLYSKYRGDGLQVVGLTKLTRNSTEEQVRNFIKERKLTYPMAKENGTASRYFNVSTIPAAAVVKDGKVVWRGNPARLTDDMVKSWL